MTVAPGLPPRPPGGFVHPLLRARDWQDRPEFGELCQWWKDGGVGVCALVGIGGAGKTAIAERFLQVLPGGYPAHPKVPKDRNLVAPARPLVFSFYDAPNPDMFFAELAAWLEGCPSADDLARVPSYQQTLESLAVAGKCLLVLDGLEKVQDDGSRGGAFGQILDGRLRDFVVRAADGWMSQVSLVITSRFRLYDPLAERTWYYRQIPIEKLDPTTALKLLRERGVRGTDDELEHIAEDLGFHALSVDLAGGYIAYFCSGDPQRFSSLAPIPVDDSEPALDPRIAAVREQERRFAHLAEQYHQALAKSDPAALVLLQRVCLFRLGVDAKTLATIFTGAGKESISGSAMAGLNEQQLVSKLKFLVEMRLLEASKSQIPDQTSQVYTVHPAVRDGFVKKLDAETARLGHDAAREGLTASLGGLPSRGSNPSSPATLDLLEEIVYHTLAAGHAEKAFGIYRYRICAYKNLGKILGAFERGERICRAFAAGQSPQIASFPAGLSENDQVVLVNEWALYLKDLGQLASAARCHERCLGVRARQENWMESSLEHLNLAEALLLAGRLPAGLHAAEEALRLTELTSGERHLNNSYSYRGFARGLNGGIDTTLADFAVACRAEESESNTPFLFSLRGIYHAQIVARLGHNALATRFTSENKKYVRDKWGPDQPDISKCNLLLADLAIERGDLTVACELLHQGHEWALQHDAKEPLCWSSLVRAKIELSAFSVQRTADQSDAPSSLTRAKSALEDGLRIARDCGFGIYHIDLLLVRAQLALHEGRAADAERDVRVALDEGVHPPEESGYPELLAATDPECLYAWGIAEGRHLLGEALLLQAAQKLGKAEFVPKRLDRLPADVHDLIDRAHEQLDQALELWRKLRDPELEAEMNPRGERTKRVLEGLEGGILAEYPIVPSAEPTQEATPESSLQKSAVPVPAPSVFVCYAQADNKPPGRWLDRLREILSPLVRQENLAVWSDQHLKIGDEWNPEIQKQLGAAKVVVLLVSPAFLASKYIANSELPVLLKRRSEGGLTILPVLLSPSLYEKARFKWPDPKTGPDEFTLSSLQAAGSPKKTLSEMTGPQRNRAFVALAERILEIVGANA